MASRGTARECVCVRMCKRQCVCVCDRERGSSVPECIRVCMCMSVCVRNVCVCVCVCVFPLTHLLGSGLDVDLRRPLCSPSIREIHTNMIEHTHTRSEERRVG